MQNNHIRVDISFLSFFRHKALAEVVNTKRKMYTKIVQVHKLNNNVSKFRVG